MGRWCGGGVCDVWGDKPDVTEDSCILVRNDRKTCSGKNNGNKGNDNCRCPSGMTTKEQGTAKTLEEGK
jgi:hypothetical protein